MFNIAFNNYYINFKNNVMVFSPPHLVSLINNYPPKIAHSIKHILNKLFFSVNDAISLIANFHLEFQKSEFQEKLKYMTQIKRMWAGSVSI